MKDYSHSSGDVHGGLLNCDGRMDLKLDANIPQEWCHNSQDQDRQEDETTALEKLWKSKDYKES
jgi:hypothetical protein